MISKNTGGPAFPQFGPQVVGLESDGAPKLEYEYSEGMTLRDYFAAKAIQGCLAYSHVSPQWGNFHENCNPDQVAEMAYRYADAMLKAREV